MTATISDVTLESMERSGWTPSQVRALIAAYREMLERNALARTLVQRLLAPGVDYGKREVAEQLDRVLMGGAA